MEQIKKDDVESHSAQLLTVILDTQKTFCEESSELASQELLGKEQLEVHNTSQNLFPDSPVYEPEEEILEENEVVKDVQAAKNETNGTEKDIAVVSSPKAEENLLKEGETLVQQKRKLSDEASNGQPKVQKLELFNEGFEIATQALDEEVSEINKAPTKRGIEHDLCSSPSAAKILKVIRSSPRKITKRSNSCTTCCDTDKPKPAEIRCASVDNSKQASTLEISHIVEQFKNKSSDESSAIVLSNDSGTSSRPSVEFVSEIRPPVLICDTILEESNGDQNDSQTFHLALSPCPPDEISPTQEKPKSTNYNSEPAIVRDRNEILSPGKIYKPQSLGYNYSDQSINHSQNHKPSEFHKSKLSIDRTTDQESTDSVSSIIMDSPDAPAGVTSKLISKLSNGNSSTPREQVLQAKLNVITISDTESDNTPDTNKSVSQNKRHSSNNESFRASNSTPSTISPLQNGHTLPHHVHSTPVFDIHIGNDEDGEFLSMYVVRTDNDLGLDMCREFQRVSKRFTIDPYLGDVSKSNSPSSVTSTGMINLPGRNSFTSIISSSTSSASNRTSDGAFIVPQPPGKTISSQGATTVKGHKALIKKIIDIFSHLPEAGNMDDITHSSSGEDKVSAGVQVSPNSLNEMASISNGSASPEEVGRCDRATPKSSLKKTRVRGRRPLASKSKRAILPTQSEEPEYMHGMNSPEMIPTNGEKLEKMMSPVREDKVSNSSLIATPKSVSKLKDKKRSRPTSPRPATPVEKMVIKPDIPGYEQDTVVLAKWVDKRYYSGRVLEITEPNKYLIKFDDGQTKALLDEFIIFGNVKELPLQGQSVYAMIDEDQNYEPGLVLAVEENESGTITYRCTTDGDVTVSVTASELYLTEDQARSIKETCRPKSPQSNPTTPRRRVHRELDLDNIIQGPRSARTRDKGSARKRVASPKSPKASTSGIKGKVATPSTGRKRRQVSESSEISEGSNSAPPAPPLLEEVAGVEPEVQKTPRKIDGVKAGPLHLKGAARQNLGKKNSKLNKFENDEDTVTLLGPIPGPGSTLFEGLHFLLTCTDKPKSAKLKKESKQDSSDDAEDDGETTSTMAGTDCEDLEFTNKPFNKERLKEQLEAAGGIVYSHFEDVPKAKYSACKLIAPRPCLTAKYIQCLAVDIRSVTHMWVITSCMRNALCDFDAFVLPAGWSIQRECFISWTARRSITVYKDKVILLCGDQDTLVKFWERVCTLVGATTRVVNEEEINTTNAIALVTECDCPHEVQNKANQDGVPLVSTTWVAQCLIEGRVCPPTGHDKFSFMYTEPE